MCESCPSRGLSGLITRNEGSGGMRKICCGVHVGLQEQQQEEQQL